MKLTTERLELIALNLRQLRLWTEDLPQLEQELDCRYQAEPMKGIFLEIVRGQLAATEADPEHYPWHSFWLMIRKTDRIVLGSADFKDVPDENGISELGYGIGPAFEHHGYTTEAARALCAWALAQPGVKHLSAETDLDGSASQRILQRLGFQEIQRAETVWWRL